MSASLLPLSPLPDDVLVQYALHAAYQAGSRHEPNGLGAIEGAVMERLEARYAAFDIRDLDSGWQ